jgi:hypothetical protein
VSAAPYSFDLLASAGYGSSCLAYWIGPCDVAALHGIDAIGITRAMSLQYDVEDQADRTGVVIAETSGWRGQFSPVAPVQLARAWSPLPSATEVLGPPDWESVEPDVMGTRAAACVWMPPTVNMGQLAAARWRSLDQERFRQLLMAAVGRSSHSGRGILIGAKPGWSYDRVNVPGAATRRLMEGVDFVVFDRHA